MESGWNVWVWLVGVVVRRYRISGIEMCVSKECEIESFYHMCKVFTCIDIVYLLYCIV